MSCSICSGSLVQSQGHSVAKRKQPPGQCSCLMVGCNLCFAGGAAVKPMVGKPSIQPLGHRGLKEKGCTCFLPGCATCGTEVQSPASVEVERQLTRTHKRVQRKPGMRRGLSRELAEDESGSDVDPAGAQKILKLDHVLHRSRRSRLCHRALASSQGPWDFWEIWSGCGHLTSAFVGLDRVAGPSVDILPNNTVPRLVLNLESEEDENFLWWLLQQYRPRHVHVSPPCTFWTLIGRLTARRTREEWQQLRRKYMHHLMLAVKLMFWQSEHGLTGSFEQPPRCVSWRLRRVRSLLALPGWQRYVWDSCRYGARDPGSGLPYLKTQAFAFNVDLSSMVVRCECQPGSHQNIEGNVVGGPRHGERRTRISGEFPAAMCEKLAAIIAAHHKQ